MTRSNYEEKKGARIERFQDLAVKKNREADQLFDKAHSIAEMIPLGQPILVGHHSEKRHRRDLDRIHTTYDKAFKTKNTAEYYAQRAASAASNNAISSDDPEALVKLRAKLADMEKSSELMKAINKIIRSKKIPVEQRGQHYRDLGLSEETIAALEQPKEYQRIMLPGGAEYFDTGGFPSFALTNNNGNMRRIKQRIEQMEREEKDVTTEEEFAGIQIIDSVEENRIMFIFPYKPDEGAREIMKQSGFRWSPSNGAWQAFRSAKWKIPHIKKRLSAMPAYVNPSCIPGPSAINVECCFDCIKKNGCGNPCPAYDAGERCQDPCICCTKCTIGFKGDC